MKVTKALFLLGMLISCNKPHATQVRNQAHPAHRVLQTIYHFPNNRYAYNNDGVWWWLLLDQNSSPSMVNTSTNWSRGPAPSPQALSRAPTDEELVSEPEAETAAEGAIEGGESGAESGGDGASDGGGGDGGGGE